MPLALGWLRASHRKLDPHKTLPYRPYHPHDEVQKLTPGEIYPLDVEIWPTCIVAPKGWRVVLSVQGHDHIVVAPGRMRHDHPEDRTATEFGGTCTLYTGDDHPATLLLPVVPSKAS